MLHNNQSLLPIGIWQWSLEAGSRVAKGRLFLVSCGPRPLLVRSSREQAGKRGTGNRRPRRPASTLPLQRLGWSIKAKGVRREAEVQPLEPAASVLGLRPSLEATEKMLVRIRLRVTSPKPPKSGV